MKLNNTFLGVRFQNNTPILGDLTLSGAFVAQHLREDLRERMKGLELMAKAANLPMSEDARNRDGWELRTEIAHALAKPAKKVYYLTNQVQEAASTIKLDRIDLKWFKQIPAQDCMYIHSKDEFYRFIKTDYRINILHYYDTHSGIPMDYHYDCYSILLNEGVLAQAPYQDKERAEKLIRFLLFIELGEITINVVKPNGKVKYGKGGDDKIKNESGMDAILVTTNWNKITVVKGEIPVRGHTRVVRCGVGRSDYRLRWIEDYVKSGYTRHSGKTIDNSKS